ncbi:DUF4252 domain-containing protein [Mariniphaga sediminis]|uniref:DUF4252 domain-containing protein n=1 Tax=Mariniphaga sediminis TaxID=1628158 RepID=UPI00356831AD
MKRIIFILLIAVIAVAGRAQTGLFEELTEKFSDKDGFSASQISSDMFDLYLKKKNIDETSPVHKALKNLDNILVLSQSHLPMVTGTKKGEKENDDTKMVHKTILDYYKKNGFSLFKTEKQMGEDVKVFLKKNQDKIESLALVTNSSVSTNLVELRGDIDLSTVSELSRELNLRGLENLYKINNGGTSYYGNMLHSGLSPERIEEMAERQRELVERQRLMTEEQRRRIEEQAQKMTEKQMQMAERYREMAEKYRRQPIFLNYPGDSTVYILNGKKTDTDAVKEILHTDKIERIEVTKSDKENGYTTIEIKTKK